MTDRADESAWHLDKKVPIGLAMMIFVQTVTLVYVGTTWKSDIDYRLASLERSDAANSNQNASQDPRITILEQKFDFIHESLARIEAKIDDRKTEPKP